MGSQPSFWDAQAPVVDQIVELQHSPSGNLHHRSGTNLWQFDGGRNHQDELRSNCPQLMKMKLIGLHEVASVPLSAICVTSLDKCLPQFPDACAESFLPKKKKQISGLRKHCTAPECTLNHKHIANLQPRKDPIGYAEIGTHLYTITVDQNTLIRIKMSLGRCTFF